MALFSSFLSIFFFITYSVHGTQRLKSSEPAHKRLLNHLLNGYDKRVRPVQDWRQAITVYLDINLNAVLEVDEKRQFLKSYIWYYESWTDVFLTWDPAEFENITYTTIPVQKIWVPDIMINEFVESGKFPDSLYAYVTHNGSIFTSKPLQVVTSCNLNIYYFPFDVQNCTLTFGSWLFTLQDMNVSLLRSKEEMNKRMSYFENHGEWELLSMLDQYLIFDYGDDLNFGAIIFYIVIKRRYLFYIVNLILPSLFLLIVDFFGFCLPPESGERVSFKITLLLGYSVFLVIVKDTLPVTGLGTPLIGVYFIVCMALLVLSLTESIFLVQIVHMELLQPHAPEWVKQLVLEKIPVILCIRDKKTFGVLTRTSSNISGDMVNTTSEQLSEYNTTNICEPRKTVDENSEVIDSILNEITSIRKWMEKSGKKKTPNEWLHIGFILDTLLFRVYIVVMLVFIITLLTLWFIV